MWGEGCLYSACTVYMDGVYVKECGKQDTAWVVHIMHACMCMVFVM